MTKRNSRYLGMNYHPEVGSKDEYLVEYLDSKYSKKEAMLEAIRSYWLPIAINETEADIDKAEMVAWEAVLNLQKQMNYICILFDLDRTKLMPLSSFSPPEIKTEKIIPKDEPKPARVSLSPTTGYSAGTGFEDWD